MFRVLFLVFFISGALTQDAELDEEDLEAERYNYTCIIPSSDTVRNGRFRVEGYDDDEQPPARKKVYSYVLQVTCNPGFNLKGWYLVQCITGKGTDEFPECLPTCKRSSPDVLSCGTGFGAAEARCLAPSDIDGISTRTAPRLQCGVTPQLFRTAVVNGREANREEVPWHAGVYTKTTRPYMQICGGTIVSNNVVISAAHCFWSDVKKILPADNYAVAVRKLYRPWNDTKDPEAQKFDVQEIRIPPRFQGSATNYQDDIALLILAAPFVIKLSSLITPACLDFKFDFDERQLTEGKLGRVSGWGLDTEDGPSSQVLNVVELPVVNIEQCIADAEPGFLPSITSDKICAGYTNGTAVCKGDSGGGLVIPEVVDGVARYYLRGIVSTAPQSDHLCNIYAVATFTHVVKHEKFIMHAINQIPFMNEPNITPTVTTFPPIIENTKRSVDKVVTDDNRNIEDTTKNAVDTSPTEDDTNIGITTKYSAVTVVLEDNTLVENTTQSTLSPLPLTNLNSTHSKDKLNTSATNSNSDDEFREIIADLDKIPQTNDNDAVVTEKVAVEPITNPPLKNDDNFDENVKDTSENADIEDIKDINLDSSEKDYVSDIQEEDINDEQSFETVNSNENPITDTTKESLESTENDTNGNIAEIPTSVIPIAITIGQPIDTVNSENLDASPIDGGSSTDTDSSNADANDEQVDIPLLTEAIEENVGQLLQTINSKAPSDVPSGVTVGTANPNKNPVTVKELATNDDSITIWPSTPGEDGVDYTQTTSILEDYWVTAGPGYDHNTPGHSHHHWPYQHGWQKQPNGQSSHHNWHKQPSGSNFDQNWHKQSSWQNHHQHIHNWRKQPVWQNWNPTSWQQERFHPFLEYHQGFTQQPSKSASSYGGPWFSRFRK